MCLESVSKVRKLKRYCFLKSYGFHSLQGVSNTIGNLCNNPWITYFTSTSYQTRRIIWSEINFYFTRHIRLLFSKDSSTITYIGYFSLSYTIKDEKKFRLLFYLFYYL